MLEHPLSGKDHGDLGIRLIASRNDIEIPVRAARLHDGDYSLFNANIDTVTEREESV